MTCSTAVKGSSVVLFYYNPLLVDQSIFNLLVIDSSKFSFGSNLLKVDAQVNFSTLLVALVDLIYLQTYLFVLSQTIHIIFILPQMQGLSASLS